MSRTDASSSFGSIQLWLNSWLVTAVCRFIYPTSNEMSPLLACYWSKLHVWIYQYISFHQNIFQDKCVLVCQWHPLNHLMGAKGDKIVSTHPKRLACLAHLSLSLCRWKDLTIFFRVLFRSVEAVFFSLFLILSSLFYPLMDTWSPLDGEVSITPHQRKTDRREGEREARRRSGVSCLKYDSSCGESGLTVKRRQIILKNYPQEWSNSNLSRNCCLLVLLCASRIISPPNDYDCVSWW